jgi:hypothetical protein
LKNSAPQPNVTKSTHAFAGRIACITNAGYSRSSCLNGTPGSGYVEVIPGHSFQAQIGELSKPAAEIALFIIQKPAHGSEFKVGVRIYQPRKDYRLVQILDPCILKFLAKHRPLTNRSNYLTFNGYRAVFNH